MKSNAYQLLLWYVISLIFLGGLILGTIIVSSDFVWGDTVSIVLACAIFFMGIITLTVRAAYKKTLRQEAQQEIPAPQQPAPASESPKKEPTPAPAPELESAPRKSEPKPSPVKAPLEDRYSPRVLAIARYIVRIQRCVISDLQAEFGISRMDVLEALKPLEHAGVIIMKGTKRLVIPSDEEALEEYLNAYEMPSMMEIYVPGQVDMQRLDPMFADVARYVVIKQEGSTSRLQRVFEIGYNRAGKLSDQLEAAGIVGPNKGPMGRDVLIQDLDQLEHLLADLGAK